MRQSEAFLCYDGGAEFGVACEALDRGVVAPLPETFGGGDKGD